jgi:hypothetical protein
MLNKSHIFVAPIVMFFLTSAAIDASTAAANNTAAKTPTAFLKSLAGAWKCTGTASNTKHLASWRMTASMMGDKWIRFSGTYPMTNIEPPGSYESLVGFDDARRQWVNIEILGSGYYMMQRSSAAPGATTQSYAETYPINKGDGPETITMTKSDLTFSYSIKAKNGLVWVRDECKRRQHS